jgi:hypothetical protein
MSWTVEAPARPGWWWAILSADEGTAEVVEIDTDGQVWRLACEDPWDVSDFEEWWDVAIKQPPPCGKRRVHDDDEA